MHSEGCSIEEQSIGYVDWSVVSNAVVRVETRTPRTTSPDTTHSSTILYRMLLK
jgi:hypothetical protein